MNDFASLLQQGNAWLFVPSAILLGALHGLEPGHSKTMMAAFIVAIRGTLKQAVLLGLAATLSHTAVVWIIAMAGLWFGRGWDAHTSELVPAGLGDTDRADRPVDGLANLEGESATRSPPSSRSP
mgnify:CR=1 FL=1